MKSREVTRFIAHRLGRRRFLVAAASGSASLWAFSGLGCAPLETGDAYEPWSFPDDETRPEWIAVGAAILAASPHNTQPWRFEITPDRIRLYADMTKSLGAMDPLHREMYIGLGCAVENLVLAAEFHGRQATVAWMPDDNDETFVADIALSRAEPKRNPLYLAIVNRHTNRGPFSDGVLPEAYISGAENLWTDPQVTATFLTSAQDRSRFRRLTIDATQAIIDDHDMNEASHAWYRHDKKAIEKYRDGVTIHTTGIDATTRAFGQILAAPSADTAGGYWLDSTKGRQTTAGAFVVLSSADILDRTQQLQVGRVFQRIHLWTTQNGLALQPLNQMAERRDREMELGLPNTFTDALNELSGPGAQMLFRVGFALDDAPKSARRPVDWVIS